MGFAIRSSFLSLALVFSTGFAFAEPLSFKQARKVIPKGNRIVADLPDTSFLEEKEQGILLSLKDSIPYFGAVALSPDEGLYVEWLNASGLHHSLKAARAAALAHCESKRKSSSAKCVVVLEVSPKGSKSDAALSLSADAATALKDGYRKLKGPKAFAISGSNGTFGYAGGEQELALEACAKAGDGADDCKVVVAD